MGGIRGSAAVSLFALAAPALLAGVASADVMESVASQPAASQQAMAGAEAPGKSSLGITAFFDNDGTIARPINNTDRHYSFGAGLAAQWQTPWVRDALSTLPSIGGEFADKAGTSYSLGLLAAMRIYTPTEITQREPDYDDRPYAGWTYAGVIAQRANRAAAWPVFEHFELDVGVTGPTSQASYTQNWAHDTFGYDHVEGWGNQISEEVGADFKYLRRYRVELTPKRPAEEVHFQLLPDAGFVAGTMHDNLNAGLTLRAGWNLPDDFGPGSLDLPADYTGPHYSGTTFSWAELRRTLSFYAFVRPAGRIVFHDTTIDGSYFRSSKVEQNSEPFVGELRGGIALSIFRCIEFGWAQTYTSHEFSGQKGCDAYGSLTLRATFTH